jgi:hypothetical protein
MSHFNHEFLDKCYFCRGKYGECTCEDLEDQDGFSYQGTTITSPNVSECAMYFVDPYKYYGLYYFLWSGYAKYEALNYKKRRVES